MEPAGNYQAEDYEARLRNYMEANGVPGEHLVFSSSCHTVNEAASAAGADVSEFVKNVCLVADGELVVAIVKGEDRASSSRVAKLLAKDAVRTATPEEMLRLSGYPCGGTPSFGFTARFLVDERVMEQEVVYTGGGSSRALVKIRSADLRAACGGEVVRVRK